MLNSVNLIGRLARTPKDSLRYAQTGTAVLPFTLAVKRKPNREGSSETDWIDGVAFAATAENMATYLEKGSLVAVEGRIQTRKYETEDGQKRKVVEVIAHTVHFLGRKQGSRKNSSEAAATVDSWSDIGKEIIIADDEFVI